MNEVLKAIKERRSIRKYKKANAILNYNGLILLIIFYSFIFI